MRNARFTLFCPFNIPQRYEIYAIYTLLTLKENTLDLFKKHMAFLFGVWFSRFQTPIFFLPKKGRDWWFQFAEAFRGWSGTNFSEGVMVKSYLGFGMTHIREEATAQGVWMQNPARKTLGKFISFVYLHFQQCKYIRILGFPGFLEVPKSSNHGKACTAKVRKESKDGKDASCYMKGPNLASCYRVLISQVASYLSWLRTVATNWYVCRCAYELHIYGFYVHSCEQGPKLWLLCAYMATTKQSSIRNVLSVLCSQELQ